MAHTPAVREPAPAYSVVIPTVGRPALAETLRPLLGGGPHAPAEVVVVDDRPVPEGPPEGADAAGIDLLRSGGRGPACARDLGWRRTTTPWVVFLDDDVQPGRDWAGELAADLAACHPGVGGSQGRIEVPPPRGRRPTDAERGTLALAEARWITADMAYRRSALEDADGFDRRFTRAYREDTDIALRVLGAGYELAAGARRSVHPLVRDSRMLRSVAAQAGNADDALMRRLHGNRWRERVGEPPGRLPRHVLTTAALAGAATAAGVSAAAARAAHASAAIRPSAQAAAGIRTAGVLGAGPEWSGAAVNAAFGARPTPGAAAAAALLHPHALTRATTAGVSAAALPGARPRYRTAAAALVAALTSGRGLPATLAAAAVAAVSTGAAPTRPERRRPAKTPSRVARVSGGLAAGLGLLWLASTAEFARRRIAPGPRTADEVARMAVTSALIPPAACAHRVSGEWRHRGAQTHAQRPVKAVLFDRDGTLVHDVPYNTDPGRVRPTPGARAALDRVRAAGLRLGVVTNQSGIARGLITDEQLNAVNAAVEDLLGPFDLWCVCTHGEDDGCACRKPRPGLIHSAAAGLGVSAAECAVIGDIGADVDAARAAGARAVLVPSPATRSEEEAAAPETAPRLGLAVRRVLRGSTR